MNSSEEELLSNQLLSNLDELMQFFEFDDDRSFTDLQKKIVLKNLLDNFNNSASKYLNHPISETDRFNSVVIQTTSVLTSAAGRLDDTGTISNLKKELKTVANQWIKRIINAKSQQDFVSINTASYIIGEFLNQEVKHYLKINPIQFSQEDYLKNYQLEFNYLYSQISTISAVVTKLQIFPKDWLTSWSTQYFNLFNMAIEFIDSTKYMLLFTENSDLALRMVFESIDLYIQFCLFSYHLVSKFGDDWTSIVKSSHISNGKDFTALTKLFEFSIGRISKILTSVEDLLAQYQEIGSRTSFSTQQQYVSYIITAMYQINSGVLILEEFLNSGRLLRFKSEHKEYEKSLKDVLHQFHQMTPKIQESNQYLEVEIVELREILFTQYIGILYYKYLDPLQQLTHETRSELLEVLPKYFASSRSQIYYILLLFCLHSYYPELKLDLTVLELINQNIEQIDNPFDQLALFTVNYFLISSQESNINEDPESIFQSYDKNIRNLPLISHLKDDLELYLNLLNPQISDKGIYPYSKPKIVTDPFTWLIPKLKENTVTYIPFNTESDYLKKNSVNI